MESSEAQPKMEERYSSTHFQMKKESGYEFVFALKKKELEKPWYIEKLWS